MLNILRNTSHQQFGEMWGHVLDDMAITGTQEEQAVFIESCKSLHQALCHKESYDEALLEEVARAIENSGDVYWEGFVEEYMDGEKRVTPARFIAGKEAECDVENGPGFAQWNAEVINGFYERLKEYTQGEFYRVEDLAEAWDLAMPDQPENEQ